ncbi:uncharacterized protein CC84DRAFT_1168522 [Paraphaeosphaeria sporulosa]|uniref:Mid2 domain-containing protein n=1 Tax=Paraphaeosphaeria sporulosa TaxID=1460663 RepID=A0A177C0Q4_9PLEO|nr:uncharacterized protein CC84DRAFT_1168522 [Paraphaeosphaeria sporulosa]OAG00422.1 hypothetical protein CC84DRAFT_1168522 [Paraphaeosphaeria sporulosa]
MSRQAGPKLSRISLLLLAAVMIPAATASSLFLRAEPVCGGKSNLQQCGGDLPASFCCASDTTCTTVNSTIQAVICCPKGKDCSTIQTVPCDTTQYNATLFPDNQIHFAETADVELPKCGDACCPLGYKCSNGMCIASQDTPSSTVPIPTSSPTTSPASASQSSGCPPDALPPPASSFDAKSFAAGFFPGLLLGALGVIAFIWLTKRRRDAKAARYSGDFGHVARTISDPIYDPQHAQRTDFIRRGSHSVSSTPSVQKPIGTRAAGGGGHGLTPRIKSMWDRTPKLAMGVWSGLPLTPTLNLQPPPPAMRAGDPLRDPYRTPGQTPSQPSPESDEGATRTHSRRRKRKHSAKPSRRPLETPTRSTSSETIDVLMPAPSFLEPPKAPAMRENRMTADSGHTTFTKLMERAGYGEDSRESVRNLSSAGRI